MDPWPTFVAATATATIQTVVSVLATTRPEGDTYPLLETRDRSARVAYAVLSGTLAAAVWAIAVF